MEPSWTKSVPTWVSGSVPVWVQSSTCNILTELNFVNKAISALVFSMSLQSILDLTRLSPSLFWYKNTWDLLWSCRICRFVFCQTFQSFSACPQRLPSLKVWAPSRLSQTTKLCCWRKPAWCVDCPVFESFSSSCVPAFGETPCSNLQVFRCHSKDVWSIHL